MELKRWVFKKDHDAHWYLVPKDTVKEFNKLLSDGENDDYITFNKKFEQMRSNGPNTISFVDPQEDV